MLPKLNRKRALFVLTKSDEILAWERRSEAERDTRFVELGRYLCEVRAGQYWRLEKLKSFDEFPRRRFPESRRKAYYLMSIHERLGVRTVETEQFCFTVTALFARGVAQSCGIGRRGSKRLINVAVAEKVSALRTE